jgi:hypothetical protein
LEVKFALNTDIATVHRQLTRYYEVIARDPARIAAEAETVFRQRLALGLYDQPANRLEAMKTLRFARDISRFQFIPILVDDNPHGTLLDLERMAGLPFAGQVKVFFTGFAMWERNLRSLAPVPGG